jgi:large subunit ribosomal protein L24e
MVENRKCTFCGGPIEPGTGKMVVKKDGAIQYYCSTKCQNNARLGRVPRLTPWTAEGRANKAKAKEQQKK